MVNNAAEATIKFAVISQVSLRQTEQDDRLLCMKSKLKNLFLSQ